MKIEKKKSTGCREQDRTEELLRRMIKGDIKRIAILEGESN